MNIYNESQKAAKIIRNLLVLIRPKKGERTLQNINNVIRQLIDSRAYEMKKNMITVAFDLSHGIPGTMLELEQIQVALNNILSNAEEAVILAGERRKIEIITRHRRGNVEVVIEDSGQGIQQDYIKRVYEPFFTTRGRGRGTGLGLFVAYEIITGHGGEISLSNRTEGGTAVEVKIPVISVQQWSEIKRQIDKPQAPSQDYKGARALVIDADAAQTKALSDILVAEGFLCDTATDSAGALDALKKGTYALLLMDLDTAARDNRRLYNSIIAEHDYLKDKIIAVSTDWGTIEARFFLEVTGCPHVTRPVLHKTLVSLVRVMLT
ncbi:MAG: hypothetical protein A3J24_05850 [Deltaproteobacteria bacterium RIFCSPLOWO2_02_FULL_53_8]|nr:MAG: hypothetical protein A3J24_05850 [Deltaproteobacteria bacterium RIFCSPLOWO2_02_FULL_53_8]